MLLVFDIGNTQIKMGVFKEERLIASWRMTTGATKTSDEYGIDIRMLLDCENIQVSSIDQVVISSVVPHVMHSFCNAVRRYVGREPLVIGPGIKTGICIKTENPKEVGADLIADVAAACEIYGAPCLVVDFGTATKYEVINEKGEFVAAVFSPGIGISADALCSRAAQLPMIEIKKPAKVLNSNTVECMQAGLVYGYIGQVQYIVEQIKKEMNLPDMQVVATGGFSKIFANELSCIDLYDAALTLKGLRIIAALNAGGRGSGGKGRRGRS